jgi:hypothetical protein
VLIADLTIEVREVQWHGARQFTGHGRIALVRRVERLRLSIGIVVKYKLLVPGNRYEALVPACGRNR